MQINNASVALGFCLSEKTQIGGEKEMAKAKTTKKKAATKTKAVKGKSSKAAPKKKAKKKTATTKKKAAGKAAGDTVVKVDRRKPKTERRRSPELEEILNAELDAAPPVDRRKTNRRRQIDPTTCERDYNGEEIEFMHALDEYKRSAGRMFPTCSEILEVVRGLGYYRLTPDQMAVLGIGVQSEESAEADADGVSNSDGELADSDEAPISPADSDNAAALGEIHAAEELSTSIRATQPSPVSTFAPTQFSSDQLVGDDFVNAGD